MSRIAALIVAAGSGSRAGGIQPKQYRRIGGVPMIRRTVGAFQALSTVSYIQVVIGAGQEREAQNALGGLDVAPSVPGGETRQDSVRRGLQALAAYAPDYVLIHDAARPLVSATLIKSVIAGLMSGAEAVLPALPLADSVRRLSSNGEWESVVREGLYRAQTPQGFKYDRISEAHKHFAGSGATDDIELAERAGMKVTIIAGEETNIKITTRDDFSSVERMMAGAGEARTGSGFDVHRFVPGDHVWLCGVRIPHDQGLEGHSDADAGLHALTDAILGAMAAGDLGQHFPPSDEKWRGAPSRVFLARAAEIVRQAGGIIVNCDITLICERPKIGPHREAMRAAIAGILELDISRISVKATTTEGLGFTGRSEGLAAQAIANVRMPT